MRLLLLPLLASFALAQPVSITVLNHQSEPLGGAGVCVECSTGSTFLTTSHTGRVVTEPSVPGPYLVRLTHRGHFAPPVTTSLVRGKHRATLRVTAFTPTSYPVNGVRYFGDSIRVMSAVPVSVSLQSLVNDGMVANAANETRTDPYLMLYRSIAGRVKISASPTMGNIYKPMPRFLRWYTFDGTNWNHVGIVPVINGVIAYEPPSGMGMDYFGDPSIVPNAPCDITTEYLGSFKKCVPTITGRFTGGPNNIGTVAYGSSREEITSNEVTTTATTTSNSSSSEGQQTTQGGSIEASVSGSVEAGFGIGSASATSSIAGSVHSSLQANSGMNVSSGSSDGNNVTSTRQTRTTMQGTGAFICAPGYIGRVTRAKVYRVYRWKIGSADPNCPSEVIIECSIHMGYEDLVTAVSYVGGNGLNPLTPEQEATMFGNDCDTIQ